MRVREQDFLIAGIELDRPGLISTEKHQDSIARNCARHQSVSLMFKQRCAWHKADSERRCRNCILDMAVDRVKRKPMIGRANLSLDDIARSVATGTQLSGGGSAERTDIHNVF